MVNVSISPGNPKELVAEVDIVFETVESDFEYNVPVISVLSLGLLEMCFLIFWVEIHRVI